MRKLLLALPFVLLSGCSLVGDDTRSILLPVVSVEVPTTVQAGESFTVEATVALLNGCISFDRFNEDRSEGRLTLTARGEEQTGGACTDLAEDVPATYTYTATEPGQLVVAVVGSDGTVEREVAVQ